MTLAAGGTEAWKHIKPAASQQDTYSDAISVEKPSQAHLTGTQHQLMLTWDDPDWYRKDIQWQSSELKYLSKELICVSIADI